MDDIFEAVSNPHRRKILQLLSVKMTVTQLIDSLPLSQSTVSSHLSVLRKAGLVGYEVRMRERLYFLNQTGVQKMKQSFDELIQQVLDIRVRVR